MTLAWLLLLTGLTISAVAIYYSVVGLAAIFSAAVIPIIIMGSALEVGKLVCASWLKANWERAPRFMKYYMIIAVVVLMLITSMGIFGFLSKAHNDQNLVSGDVQSKIALYDEKIKIAKDNIDANRKALKQMDEAVDQVMARSSDEKGADKAVAVRRSQQKERGRLLSEIEAEQKKIVQLNESRAPIAAEVRKVEAEVGPIKYIAKFIYGDKAADENMLEKAVTWIIILIVIVFDPLAVIMLLAAQMTFQWHRENKNTLRDEYDFSNGVRGPILKEEPEPTNDSPTVWPFPSVKQPVEVPNETPSTALGGDITAPEEKAINLEPDFLKQAEERVQERIEEVKQEEPSVPVIPLEQWNKMIEEAEKAVEEEKKAQVESDSPEAEETEESKKKTYMTKDNQGQIQIKNRS
jgi:hypothetical protein